jgi:hypothetical protein
MSNGDSVDRQSTADVEQGVASRTERGRNIEEHGKWVSALIALIGLWLVVETLVFDLSVAQLWNDLVVGALLLATGGYNYFRQRDEYFGSVGAAAIAALLGLWLVLAPFVFGTGRPGTEVGLNTAVWNDLVVGVITFALGAYSAYKIRDWRRSRRAAV